MPSFSLCFLLLTTLLALSSTSFAGDALSTSPHTAKTKAYDIIQTSPHRPSAFTQGLTFLNNEVLLEGTGQYGHSTLAQIDWPVPASENASNKVRQEVALKRNLFGEGITVFNGRIYQLTWKAGRCLIYDAQNLQLTHTLRYKGQGWGLTNNSHQLIMSNGSAKLSFRDPANFTETSSITVRDQGREVRGLNELEWVKGQIYANVWQSNIIVVIAPETGEVLEKIDLSTLRLQQPRRADVLNGIAYHAASDTLVVTGKYWSNLYSLRIH